eukprot:947735-Pelagomonas_calceolata.AAC.1
MRWWLHELLPACVIATGCIGRAKLVLVMHMGFKLVFQLEVSEVKGCGIMVVPSGRRSLCASISSLIANDA